MEISEGEDTEQETEEIFEAIMTEKFPRVMSDTKPQIQEAQRRLGQVNAKELHLGISSSNYRKSKIKSLKRGRKNKNKNTLSVQEQMEE